MKNIRTKAAVILGADTIAYSGAFALMIHLVTGGETLVDYFLSFLYVVVMFGVYRYRVYFSDNVGLHAELVQKFGESYVDALTKQLQSRSLRSLIYSRWFEERAKEAWPGKVGLVD